MINMMWLYCFIIYIIVGLILSILMLIEEKSPSFRDGMNHHPYFLEI